MRYTDKMPPKRKKRKTMKVTVLGSCVSRVSLLRGNIAEHGIVDGEKNGLEIEYFLDKHNIALAMLPPPFTKEEVNTITSEYFFDKSREVSLKQSLMKQTISLLLNGEAEYLIMDFYDFHNVFLAYKDTAFAIQSDEFLHTSLCQKYVKDLKPYTFFNMPTWTYYPLVDLFFEKNMQKFDADHIILNRFRANTFFLHTDGKILTIPESSKRPNQCDDKKNPECKRLESYVIEKYNPYVIDISNYFMGDANVWNNWNASHFEKEFYRETYDQILRIIRGEATERYFDEVRLFDQNRSGFQEDMARKFDVEWGLEFYKVFAKQEPAICLNVLDKLYCYAPEDERVIKCMEAY